MSDKLPKQTNHNTNKESERSFKSMHQTPPTNFPPFFPLPLQENVLTALVEESKAFAFAVGLVMGTSDGDDSKVTHAPIALIPAPLPVSVFRQAYELGPDFNLLVHRASRDHQFICQCLEKCVVGAYIMWMISHFFFCCVKNGDARVAEVDSFTASLLRIYKQVHNEGRKQVTSFFSHSLFLTCSLLYRNGTSVCTDRTICCMIKVKAHYLSFNK
jgi:hypothetical protein